jgi:hypothetical protein
MCNICRCTILVLQCRIFIVSMLGSWKKYMHTIRFAIVFPAECHRARGRASLTSDLHGRTKPAGPVRHDQGAFSFGLVTLRSALRTASDVRGPQANSRSEAALVQATALSPSQTSGGRNREPRRRPRPTARALRAPSRRCWASAWRPPPLPLPGVHPSRRRHRRVGSPRPRPADPAGPGNRCACSVGAKCFLGLVHDFSLWIRLD